jgi:hypothetical protein
LSWIDGGLQDLVVNEAERPFIQLDRIVLAVGKDRERRLGFLLLLLDLQQNCLREPSLQNSSKDVPRSQDYSGNTIPRLIDDDLSTEAYGYRGRRV